MYDSDEDPLTTVLSEIPAPFVFLLLCVTSGVASLSLCSRSVSPAILFFLAVIISKAAVISFDNVAIKRAYEKYTWILTSREEIIYILLPPLIFETAYSFEVQDFRKHRLQILILGSACYFVNVAALSSIMYVQMYVVNQFMEDAPIWSVSTCLLYASAANAIDPITATTMLHHVGLPHHLYVLIKGETMINGAMAVFTYTTVSIATTETMESAALWIFMLLAGLFVSMVLGYMVGRMGAYLLRHLHTDTVRENIILVVFVYGIFAICELIRGSGYFAIFVFAFALNVNRTWMNREQYEASQRMWTAVAFYANCIIVIMTALRTSLLTSNSTYVHAGIVFVTQTITRACSLFICIPILRAAGAGRFPFEYSCLLFWCSVRGATSLLLTWTAYGHGEDESVELRLWLVGITVACGHFAKGMSLKWVAYKLGLVGISRADRKHLEHYVERLNERIKEKIAIRKALPSYSEADWNKIEKTAFLRLKNEGRLAVDLTRVDMTISEDDENEWHAREAMKRICEIELSCMAPFGALSLALRRVQQAFSDSMDSRTKVPVNRLFYNMQPLGIWRKLFPTGGWSPAWLNTLVGRRGTATNDFSRLRWCAMTSAQAIAVLLTFMRLDRSAEKWTKPKVFVFICSLITLFNTAELILRIWNRRNQFRHVYINNPNMMEWLYLASSPCYPALLTLLIYIGHKCTKSDPVNIEMGGTLACSHTIRVLTMILTGVCWLHIPLTILLVIRIASFEIGRLWQTADEATLEALQALMSVSTRIITDLKNGALQAVEPTSLRRRLSEELAMVRMEAEEKLKELYHRRGGSELLQAINTRRAAYDLLYDAVQAFENAKQLGELDDNEYKMAIGAVEGLRSKAHRWAVETSTSSYSS